MPHFPRLKSRQVIKALEKSGFKVLRIKGSHHFLAHQDGRRTVVPVHKGEIIGIGLLHKILHDCEIERDDFIKLLK